MRTAPRAGLLPGDIVLVTSDGIISRAIRFFTRLPGEQKTRFSHCEIVVTGGWIGFAEVVSADARGIQQRPISPFHKGKTVTVYRPAIPWEERSLAGFKALALRGRKYPFWRLFMHLFDRMLGGSYFFRRFGRSPYNPECGAMVALVYSPQIQFLNQPWWAVAPDDIDDHCAIAGYQVVWEGVCDGLA